MTHTGLVNCWGSLGFDQVWAPDKLLWFQGGSESLAWGMDFRPWLTQHVHRACALPGMGWAGLWVLWPVPGSVRGFIHTDTIFSSSPRPWNRAASESEQQFGNRLGSQGFCLFVLVSLPCWPLSLWSGCKMDAALWGRQGGILWRRGVFSSLFTYSE